MPHWWNVRPLSLLIEITNFGETIFNVLLTPIISDIIRYNHELVQVLCEKQLVIIIVNMNGIQIQGSIWMFPCIWIPFHSTGTPSVWIRKGDGRKLQFITLVGQLAAVLWTDSFWKFSIVKHRYTGLFCDAFLSILKSTCLRSKVELRFSDWV